MRSVYENEIHYLPDFCSIRGVFAVVLVAQALAFTLELSSCYQIEQYWSGLGVRSLFIQWIALSSAAILCLFRSKFEKFSSLTTAIVVFVIIQIITLAVSSMVAWGMDRSFDGGSLSVSTSEFFFRNLGVSCIVTIVLLRYLHVQFQWKIQQRGEQEARLAALQSRIRPHFLFNSLNTIASLTRSDPSLAEELVQDLAELFRASLMQNQKFIRLDDELELVKQYLNIEHQRLGERLKVFWEIGDIPQDSLIPPLTLQPLVENAVYHGVELAELGGKIWLQGRSAGDKLVLTIKNTLAIDRAGLVREGNRIAVDNISARIQGCFPETGQVLISTVDDCYQVRVVIPRRVGAQ